MTGFEQSISGLTPSRQMAIRKAVTDATTIGAVIAERERLMEINSALYGALEEWLRLNLILKGGETVGGAAIDAAISQTEAALKQARTIHE